MAQEEPTQKVYECWRKNFLYANIIFNCITNFFVVCAIYSCCGSIVIASFAPCVPGLALDVVDAALDVSGHLVPAHVEFSHSFSDCPLEVFSSPDGVHLELHGLLVKPLLGFHGGAVDLLEVLVELLCELLLALTDGLNGLVDISLH